MHVLLTNDDGISAPGLQALESAMQQLGWQFTVVAPAMEHSQCGHRVTTHQHLKVETLGVNRHAVHGTPADCVRLALFALDVKPDLVLSGVNAGGNMGQDVVISGTVAAAREAAYHGIRAMALSHYLIRELAVDWQRTSAWISEIVRETQAQDHPHSAFWNINLPHLPAGHNTLPPRIHCQPARSPLQVSYRKEAEGYAYSASYASRPRDPGSDVETCFGGKVSVSLLRV
ncbi:5'/3'-nucleotidase SurE [Prosthecobacter sp.]|uniref:5'/3'-nucleotidase SurE n=1 Tax=Prosthecobacter sp. TaxID=1965333 RepID=UPI00248933EF|nr:5'/3'-nucleotidase SurE [Prosthecobacter sp.]MDI1313537.1 5'/3'-nucleotidase SurE [Prosthecobacter sp.]